MSKLAPRNATVQILRLDDGHLYVHKRYHSVYTATQEQHAYRTVQLLCRDIQGIRLAYVLGVDEKENSLHLEYIPGKSLYELLEAGKIDPIIQWTDRLVELFSAAKTQKSYFDSDPSNFIIHAKTGELVIIDPVCTNLRLEDFAMVVFLWGLIKLMLRKPRFWQYPSLIRVWRTFYREYLQRGDVESGRFNHEMVRYIDVVIKWNREVSPVDSLLITLMRRMVVVPMYMVVRWFFHLNLVHV
jgi:hypothetical protein